MGNNDLSTLEVDKIYNIVKGRINSLVKDSSFNIIEAAVRTRLRETAHSSILANILRYEDKILKSFLEKFSFSDIADQEWEISTEKNNMDIVLEGTEDVIIIENKVNNAWEQPNQIDRYVQHYKDAGIDSGIYVLYLNRSGNWFPSPYSWSETVDDCKLIAASYDTGVRVWLKYVRDVYAKTTDRDDFVVALSQYIDYLDKMFDEGAQIMEEYKTKIRQILGLEASDSLPIDKLDATIEILNRLKGACENMKYEQEWKDINRDVNALLSGSKLAPLLDNNSMNWDLPDAGIPFKLKDYDNQFYAVISYLQQSYIGVINTKPHQSFDESLSSRFKDTLKGMNKTAYSTGRYPIWFKCTDKKDLISSYCKMIGILRNNDEIDSWNEIEVG